ncbi:MAG: TrmH family RNA methyltransferase [Porticoccaceae bacterium]
MDYREKKQFYARFITVYGRNPVLEVLRDPHLSVHRLHLATSNRPDGTIAELLVLAQQRGIEVRHHSREALARISKNGRQDQGVAADIACPRHADYRDLPLSGTRPLQLLALDRVTNPQNLGMIVRTVCASPLDGLLLPRQGCAALSPLVVKASAGTLFRCPLWRCERLPDALAELAAGGVEIVVLAADAPVALGAYRPRGAVVYVLGNETEGVSAAVSALAKCRVRIPMANGVESLNVAVTAALIAFRSQLATPE